MYGRIRESQVTHLVSGIGGNQAKGRRFAGCEQGCVNEMALRPERVVVGMSRYPSRDEAQHIPRPCRCGLCTMLRQEVGYWCPVVT